MTTGTCPATSTYAPGCTSGCTSSASAGAGAAGYGRRLLDGSGYGAGSASGSASGSVASGYSDTTDCSASSNTDVCQAAQQALGAQKQAAPQLICQVRGGWGRRWPEGRGSVRLGGQGWRSGGPSSALMLTSGPHALLPQFTATKAASSYFPW